MKKAHRNGKRYMADDAFSDLMDSAGEALQHSRGERADLRVTRVALPAPPKPITPGHVKAKLKDRTERNCRK